MSWPIVKLGDVCVHDIRRVRTLPQEVETIAYIDIGSIKEKRITQYKEVTRTTAPGRAQQLLRAGDVIVSTVRPNLNTLALVEDCEFKFPLVASTGFCVLRATEKVLPKFLYHWLQEDDVVRRLSIMAEAKASYPAVTDSEVFSLSLPLPPLPEQARIVEELEGKLLRLAKVEQVAREAVAVCAQARRAVFAEAFRNA